MRLLSRDEIAAGIRNALERGYSLDQAVQSFINAGYNPNEVDEAARLFSSGALPIINRNAQQPKQQDSETISSMGQKKPEKQAERQTVNAQEIGIQKSAEQSAENVNIYQYIPPKQKSRIGLIIFLIVILLILIGAIVFAVIYKDSISTFLSETFSNSDSVAT